MCVGNSREIPGREDPYASVLAIESPRLLRSMSRQEVKLTVDSPVKPPLLLPPLEEATTNCIPRSRRSKRGSVVAWSDIHLLFTKWKRWGGGYLFFEFRFPPLTPASLYSNHLSLFLGRPRGEPIRHTHRCRSTVCGSASFGRFECVACSFLCRCSAALSCSFTSLTFRVFRRAPRATSAGGKDARQASARLVCQRRRKTRRR